MNWRICLASIVTVTAFAQPAGVTRGAKSVTQMEVFRVLGDPVGVLGFDREVVLRGLGLTRRLQTVRVYRVLPNTAASKAGLRPGDAILKSDGKPVSGMTKGEFDAVWKEKQRIGQSGGQMIWDLSVLSDGDHTPHVVHLSLPSPAPWWGAPHYAAPEGRNPCIVEKSGPLAEKAKIVLDYGYWIALPEQIATSFDLEADGRRFLCYGWTVDFAGQTHMMLVSQQRHHTDIILVVYSKGIAGRVLYFLTDPSSGLLRAARLRGKAITISGTAVEETFASEVDLWARNVNQGTRWPLEIRAASSRSASSKISSHSTTVADSTRVSITSAQSRSKHL